MVASLSLSKSWKDSVLPFNDLSQSGAVSSIATPSQPLLPSEEPRRGDLRHFAKGAHPFAGGTIIFVSVSRYSPRSPLAVFTAIAISLSLTSCSGFFPGANDITALTIAPSNAMLAPGGVQQYTATATYGNNTTGDATNVVNWSSSTTSIATITSTGLATAGSQLGTTTIQAQTGSVISKTGLTVSNSTVTSVTVSPASVSLIAGQTQQLAATANFSNNSSSNVTNLATWTSSNSSVATVSGGLVTAVATGTATIFASYSGQVGNATVTVQ